MGSGKGIVRRVQVASPSPDVLEVPSLVAQERVLFDANKWADFIRVSGLKGGSRNVKIYEYYMGKWKSDEPKWYWTVDDYKAMLTELFEDAVALGVIVLPSPYTIASFQFFGANHPR